MGSLNAAGTAGNIALPKWWLDKQSSAFYLGQAVVSGMTVN